MLATYAEAVRRMKQLPEGDPRSWTFQWYIHGIPRDRGKRRELVRVYPTPTPDRQLAEQSWETCQPHGRRDPQDLFLPWHRAYVLFFEHVVRAVSGDPDFTLPYWDYSATAPELHGVVPPEFRQPTDPVLRTLYAPNRKRPANDGLAIDINEPGDPLSLSVLTRCTYADDGLVPGFCPELEGGLHAWVHDLVGDASNMGAVPTAARDPLFWLHHCNIDRLWASWQAVHAEGPSVSSSFVFADARGKSITINSADFVNLDQMEYRYDRLEPVAVCPPTAPIAQGPPPVRTDAFITAQSPQQTRVALGATPTRVTLRLTPATSPDKRLFAGRVRGLGASGRLYLEISELHAQTEPGVLFHLYLQLPDNASPQVASARHVGILSFFGAVHDDNDEPRRRTIRFDITDVARDLLRMNALADAPIITIAPSGTPVENSLPVIGDIRLIER